MDIAEGVKPVKAEFVMVRIDQHPQYYRLN
jgi:hypothetical protein